MSMVGFPLLLIPLAIFNIIVFLMPGVSLAEPIVKLTLMSGAEWPLTLSDMLLALGIVLLLLRGHQGRASRREISHRSSVVADHIRRRRRRVSAVAAVRQFDLFPARVAGVGGFPVGDSVARPARGAGGVSRSAGSPAGRLRHARIQARSQIRRSRAGGAGSRFGRRIGATGPPSTENCPSRPWVAFAVAGNAVARAPARQRIAAATRRAALTPVFR